MKGIFKCKSLGSSKEFIKGDMMLESIIRIWN
jgi:hypothetical protein